MADLSETSEFPEGIYQIETTDPVIGGAPNVGTGAGMSNIPHLLLANRTRYLKEALDALTASTPVTLTVGPGGQHSTINAALQALSKSFPAYVPGGFVATIHLLTGFVMAEQVRVQGVNLGWINITSADPVVTIQRSALTAMVIDGYPAFAATEGGVLPQISALFEMNTTGDGTDRHGIMLRGGQATIWSGAGVRRAGGHGIYARSASTVTASGSDFSLAGQAGIRAINGSNVNALNATFTGCYDGVVSESGSIIAVPNANMSGATNRGAVAISGGRVAATGSNARKGGSDSSQDFVVSTGGNIAANGATGGTSITTNTLVAAGFITK